MFKVPKEIPKELELDIKSLEEEKANKYSHLFGIILWILTNPLLLFQAFKLEDNIVILGVVIYSISFLLLFTFSTLYHSSYDLQQRIKFRTMDHIGIYCFIAGTYTPILLMYINNSFGLKVLVSLWLITLIGTIFKFFFVGKFKLVSTIIYLLMGWTAIFMVNQLLETMPKEIFNWIMLGGFFFTVGTFFYMKKTLKYTHLYWHIFVLLGVICHLTGIYKSVLLQASL